MSGIAPIDDWEWLVGLEGEPWLARAAADGRSLVGQTVRLRRSLSAARTHLVLQQIALRQRAAAKFPDAARMFFTDRGLQQSSDHWVAAYKARRMPPGEAVADLCCGIGGDLLGLARRGPVVGVDRDPVATTVAKANARPPVLSGPEAGRVAVCTQDVADFDPGSVAAWHLDPDRRPRGRRTTMVHWHEPGTDTIERLLAISGEAAVKLAPAAVLPRAWAEKAEQEWIGRDRQCRQLVVWFGGLAEHPGKRRATLLAEAADGSVAVAGALVGDEDQRVAPAERLGRYVYDSDPSVRAAGLAGALAGKYGLEATGAGPAYLTGDRAVADPLLSCFEVLDVTPLDVRRLKRMLRERGIGRLEIKKRGVGDEPEQLRRRLQLRGEESAVLLVTPIDGAATAIIARRAR